MSEKSEIDATNNWLQTLQNSLALVVGFGAILTVSGFVAVHAHIGRYTDIPHYGLTANTYLPAGFLMFFVYAVNFFIGWILGRLLWRSLEVVISRQHWTLRFITAGIIIFLLVKVVQNLIDHNELLLTGVITLLLVCTVLLFSFVVVISGIADSPEKFSSIKLWALTLRDPQKALIRVFSKPFNLAGLFVVLIATFYVLLGGVFFGIVIYGNAPRAWGGGQPATVSLLFEETAVPEIIGLGAVQESEMVCLLASTESAILVFDPVQRTTTEIDKSHLLAIRDEPGTANICSPIQ